MNQETPKIDGPTIIKQGRIPYSELDLTPDQIEFGKCIAETTTIVYTPGNVLCRPCDIAKKLGWSRYKVNKIRKWFTLKGLIEYDSFGWHDGFDCRLHVINGYSFTDRGKRVFRHRIKFLEDEFEKFAKSSD